MAMAMAAATPGSGGQQTWAPYEPGKDCSMGFCSIYCPQWCYIIFPPPPPVEFSDDGGSNSTFSPLVIAIIGILASAFLLVSYYTIITKYCGGFDSLLRRLGSPGHGGRRELEDSLDQSQRHEAWDVSPSNGLDETSINKITVYKYKRGNSFIEGTDCSVCLSEFLEDDSLRLLPKCSHAFHVQCIDTWLRFHSNCPLCRANIVSVHLASPPPPLHAPTHLPSSLPAVMTTSAGREVVCPDEIVIVLDDLVIGGEENHLQNCSNNLAEENHLQNCSNNLAEESSSCLAEMGDGDHDHNDQAAIRQSFSLDSFGGDRLSIADVLQMSMEEEISAAKDRGLRTGVSSSRHAVGDQGKGSGRTRGLHLVMSPVAMKKSGGKFCLTRNARGRNEANPMQDDSNSRT